MRSLPLPADTVASALALCVNGMQDQGKAASFVSVGAQLSQSENDYIALATTASLHSMPQTHLNGSVITKDDMAWLYRVRLVGGGGRVCYDKIQAASSVCPYCMHMAVVTLDHVLPKAIFPALAITPANLVPSCRDCNEDKLAEVATQPGEVPLHPYFDVLPSGVWLEATLTHESPVGVEFKTKQPTGWTPVLFERVTNHFDRFHLGRLYAIHAGIELIGIRKYVSDLFVAGGAIAVEAYLAEQEETWSVVDPNSWKSVTYRAARIDGWYSSGGFVNAQ